MACMAATLLKTSNIKNKKQKKFDRKRWQDKNNSMLKIIKPLYRNVNGISIASESKQQTGTRDKSLTYGQCLLSISTSIRIRIVVNVCI